MMIIYDYDTTKSEQYRFPKTSDVSCCFSTHGRRNFAMAGLPRHQETASWQIIEVPNQNGKDISKYHISRPNKTQN
jgi:hypothetical protein